MRLNKFLADCGVGSRRACDKLIEEGKVKVNDKVATVTTQVDDGDKVSVNGKRVGVGKKLTYIMLHKPKGCVTTVTDDLGRKTVMDFIKDIHSRVYPVGRLDYDTEGLLLLTNDGDLANKLTHPSNEVPKTYIARISGALSDADIRQLEKGVMVDGKVTAPAIVKVLQGDVHHTRVEITIHEGRNRQVKKMFEAVGKEVEFLKRVAVGDLHLGGLQRGKYRFLTEKEVNYLKNL